MGLRHIRQRAIQLMLGAAIIPGGALAQSAPPAPPSAPASAAPARDPAEIVVTATRREESLQKVPLAVSVMSAASLTAKNILSITDISTGQVPGVIFQAFGGTVSSVEVAVRGVSTNDPDQATRELPVPMYIDGVYLGRGQGLGLQLIDPERVEVLRGPQGTLFGRNAEGGAIQYVSRKPTGTLGMDATATYGNYDLGRIRASVNLPEIAGFKILVSGLYSDQNGFTRNVPANSLGTGSVDGDTRQQADFSQRSAVGARAAVRWDKVANLVIDYTFDWSRTHDSQAYLTYTGPQIPGAAPPSTAFPTETPVPLYNSPFITTASGHALTAQYKASDAITLKSITSYREVSKAGYANLGTSQNLAAAFGLPVVPANAIYYIADQDLHQHQFSQEVQMLGSWNRLTLTTGAVYYIERAQQLERSTFFSGPGLAAFGLPDFHPGAQTGHHVSTDSLGIYAQGTWQPPILDDKLDLTAGLRYADDKKTTLRYEGPGDGFGLTQVPLDLVALADAKRFDPAFTIKYNFSSVVNVYARYAQAYRGGGASVRSLEFLPFGSEVTKEFEFGFKTQTADHKLTFNGALYQNKVYNPQTDVGESPTLSQATITINAPIVRRVRGIEFDLSYRTPIPGLTLTGTYAHMNVRQPAFINPNDPAAGLVVSQILFSPTDSGSINADYTRPAGFADFVLHSDFSYSSPYHNGGEIDPIGVKSATAPEIVRQWNARVTLDKLAFANKALSVSFWVKNLLNRTDNVYSFGVPDDHVHSYNYIEDPRTYGVDVRYHF